MNETPAQDNNTDEAGRVDPVVIRLTHQGSRIVESRREMARRRNVSRVVHVAAMRAISQWMEFSERTGHSLSWSVFINDFDSDSAFPGELGEHKKIAYNVMKKTINMSESEFAKYFKA